MAIRSNLRNALVAVCSLIYASMAQAQKTNESTPEPSKLQVLLQLDNDLFSGSDRDYTSGIRVGFVQELPLESDEGQRMNERFQEASNLLYRPLQFLGINEDSNLRFARGVGLSQLLFTPEDPRALSAPEGERPYAGWLGLEYSLHAKSEDLVNSITVAVGTTGEASLAQPSQDWVHRNISKSPLFQGWDSQVPGELTLNLHFDHKRRFHNLYKVGTRGLEIDGYYEGGLALGNFRTDAYVGSLARIGFRLPSSFSTPRVQLGSYGHQLFSDNRDFSNKISAYAFGGVRATGVLHDITLDGPVFRDFDTGVKSSSLVGELIYGFGMRYKKIELIYSQTIRSEEFNSQTENLQFGSVMLRFQSGLR